MESAYRLRYSNAYHKNDSDEKLHWEDGLNSSMFTGRCLSCWRGFAKDTSHFGSFRVNWEKQFSEGSSNRSVEVSEHETKWALRLSAIFRQVLVSELSHDGFEITWGHESVRKSSSYLRCKLCHCIRAIHNCGRSCVTIRYFEKSSHFGDSIDVSKVAGFGDRRKSSLIDYLK